MNVTAAAAIVLRASQSHVSLTAQPLELDSGRCHRHLLALQTAVAAKVSGEKKIVKIFLLWSSYSFSSTQHVPIDYELFLLSFKI